MDRSQLEKQESRILGVLCSSYSDNSIKKRQKNMLLILGLLYGIEIM